MSGTAEELQRSSTTDKKNHTKPDNKRSVDHKSTRGYHLPHVCISGDLVARHAVRLGGGPP